MTAPKTFVRIDEARCPNCGPKRAFRHRGREYDLPITMDAVVVERSPWKCECGKKIQLEVEMVE